MTTQTEALKLALEALNDMACWQEGREVDMGFDEPYAADTSRKAIAAIEALAQPKQEPVAIRYDFDGYGYQYIDSGTGSDWQKRVKGEPLYTTPKIEVGCAECGVNDNNHALYCVECAEKFVGKAATKLQQKQETIEGLNRDYDLLFAEYQLLLKKEWVGLTDDEIYKIAFTLEGEHWKKIADAIESKLKDKNNNAKT